MQLPPSKTICLIALLACFSASGLAADLNQVLAKIDALSKSETEFKSAAAEGQATAEKCAACHGSDGNSPKTHIANIANQAPQYFATRLLAYASDKKHDLTMQSIAKGLSENDVVNLSAFYALQAVSSRATELSSGIADGEIIYQTNCADCHGSNALGNATAPRLSGQPEEYLINAMDKYQSGELKTSNEEKAEVMQDITLENMVMIAAYLTQYQP